MPRATDRSDQGHTRSEGGWVRKPGSIPAPGILAPSTRQSRPRPTADPKTPSTHILTGWAGEPNRNPPTRTHATADPHPARSAQTNTILRVRAQVVVLANETGLIR